MGNGVLYVAYGQKYVKEAAHSAYSLARYNPDLPVTLYTNVDVSSPYFDDVVVTDVTDPSYPEAYYMLGEEMMPYEKTLRLDTDTYVCDDISDVFEVLERSDLAVPFAPPRTRPIYDANGIDIPEAFPEYNGGVLAYNDSEAVHTFFEEYGQNYHDLEYGPDLAQPALRYTLYNSELNIASLPREYNFRTHVVGYAHKNVKILHGRPQSDVANLAKFERIVNATDERRVTTWHRWPVHVVTNSDRSLRFKAGGLLEAATKKAATDGYRGLARGGINFLKRHLRGILQ